MINMEVNSANQRLEEISTALFKGQAELRIVQTKDLDLLKVNARYMEKKTFDQLTNNIKEDGFLSSVPLCAEENGRLIVLSGNHRVKGGIEAGLDNILVIVDKRDLSKSKKVAIQLSHNSLTGQDDEAILASLWGEIDIISAKLYAGLDSKMIEKLENEKYSAFNPAQIPTKQLVFWFIPSDLEHIEKVLEDGRLTTGDSTHVVDIKSHEKIVDLIIKIKKSRNIKNSALALQTIIDLALQKLDEEGDNAGKV
jgi:hypothetical protein